MTDRIVDKGVMVGDVMVISLGARSRPTVTPEALFVCLTTGSPVHPSTMVRVASWMLRHRPDLAGVLTSSDQWSALTIRRDLLQRLRGHLAEPNLIARQLESMGMSVARVGRTNPLRTSLLLSLLKVASDALGVGRLLMDASEHFFASRYPPPPVPAAKPSLSTHRSRRVTILFIVPWLEIGGAEKVNLDLLRALPSDAYRKIIVTTRPSCHPWMAEFEAATDMIIDLQSIASVADEAFGFLRDLVSEESVDIIQISNSRLGYRFAATLRAHTFVPTISLVHMSVPHGAWDYVHLSRHYKNGLDVTVAVSPSLRDEMVHLGFKPESLHIIRNGVDTTFFAPPLDHRHGTSPRTVLFVGRLVEQKDPLAFVEIAAAISHRTHPTDVRFVVIGDGPLRSRLESRVSHLGIADRVEVTGTLLEDQVVRHLQDSSLLVMPSRWEGLPVVGIEALACGLPIVARRVSGWTDLLGDGKGGILLDGPPQAFADIILRLLGNAPELRRLAQEARAKATTDYTLEKMSAAYRTLYASLLQTP